MIIGKAMQPTAVNLLKQARHNYVNRLTCYFTSYEDSLRQLIEQSNEIRALIKDIKCIDTELGNIDA